MEGAAAAERAQPAGGAGAHPDGGAARAARREPRSAVTTAIPTAVPHALAYRPVAVAFALPRLSAAAVAAAAVAAAASAPPHPRTHLAARPPAGASLLLDLLQRKERLEAARAAQRARTEALQAELSAADETLSAKVEQMRAEEAEVWSDFLPLLHAKRARLRKLEADALERDLSLSDVEAGAGHGESD